MSCRSPSMLTLLALLSACVTPTHYQPLTASGDAPGGYSEQRLGDGYYHVAFTGNVMTSRRHVRTYMIYRAAQLTLKNGYDGFTVVEGGLNRTRNILGGVSWSGGAGGHDDSFIDTADSFEAVGEIRMFHGSRPNDPRSFDARGVVAELGPTIKMAHRD